MLTRWRLAVVTLDGNGRAVGGLLAARFVRSVWQGALVVGFALYLQRLDWSGPQIGALFAASFVLGAALSLAVGPLSDARGYRRLLVGYELAVAAAFVATLFNTTSWVIATCAMVAGFGRGANGAPGCFVPAELAWLAGLVPERRRSAVFSANTAFGFAGMAVGAAIAAGPGIWGAWLAGAAAFQPLFALGAVLALVNVRLLLAVPEVSSGAAAAARARPALSSAVRARLLKVTASNLCNGLSVGLSGPLMAYWFAVKFGVGPLQIGPVVMASFLAAALCAAAIGRMAAGGGGAALFVRLQCVALLLLLLLPLAGGFWWASALWVAKVALERGSSGAMEAVNVGLAGHGRWGLASGLSVASLALPRAVGPLLAGHWIGSGAFAAPFVAAAGLQAVYLVMYWRAVAPASGRISPA